MSVTMSMLHVHIHVACPSSCCMSQSHCVSFPCCLSTFKLQVHTYVARSCLCCLPMSMCMSMSTLHVQVHLACPCQCSIFESMLHVHVHAACPCPYCISMSMLHVHVNAAFPSPCSTDIDMKSGHKYAAQTWTCRWTWLRCMDMEMHGHAVWTLVLRQTHERSKILSTLPVIPLQIFHYLVNINSMEIMLNSYNTKHPCEDSNFQP